MARPTKATVDYFPHFVVGGKTMFIIENRFGNDGYAFWFKLLEVLATTDGMVYDCNNDAEVEFLLAKTRVSADILHQILDSLATLGAIDRELWEKDRLIWCQNLVDNVQDAFKRRTSSLPKKPVSGVSADNNSVYADINEVKDEFPQTETGKGKERERKEKGKKDSADANASKRFIKPSIQQVIEYCQERNNNVDAQRWYNHYESNGWKVGKNGMKDWKAAVRTWESNSSTSLRGNSSNNSSKFDRSKNVLIDTFFEEGGDGEQTGSRKVVEQSTLSLSEPN